MVTAKLRRARIRLPRALRGVVALESTASRAVYAGYRAGVRPTLVDWLLKKERDLRV
jgi:hypothetical protein